VNPPSVLQIVVSWVSVDATNLNFHLGCNWLYNK